MYQHILYWLFIKRCLQTLVSQFQLRNTAGSVETIISEKRYWTVTLCILQSDWTVKETRITTVAFLTTEVLKSP